MARRFLFLDRAADTADVGGMRRRRRRLLTRMDVLDGTGSGEQAQEPEQEPEPEQKAC